MIPFVQTEGREVSAAAGLPGKARLLTSSPILLASTIPKASFLADRKVLEPAAQQIENRNTNLHDSGVACFSLVGVAPCFRIGSSHRSV